MDQKDLTPQEILDQSIKSKAELRSRLIELPFDEKIRRVIEMQKIERELKKDKTKKVYVWSL